MVYPLEIVIFHGYVTNNQMVASDNLSWNILIFNW